MKLHKSHLINSAGKEILLVSLLAVNWSRHHPQAVLRQTWDRVWVRPGQPCLMGCPRCSRIYSLNCGMGTNTQVTGLQDQYLSNTVFLLERKEFWRYYTVTLKFILRTSPLHITKGRVQPKEQSCGSRIFLSYTAELRVPNALRGTLPSPAQRGK